MIDKSKLEYIRGAKFDDETKLLLYSGRLYSQGLYMDNGGFCEITSLGDLLQSIKFKNVWRLDNVTK